MHILNYSRELILIMCKAEIYNISVRTKRIGMYYLNQGVHVSVCLKQTLVINSVSFNMTPLYKQNNVSAIINL